MIELAKNTTDSNKRAFIIEAFSLLPAGQRIELGHSLSSSNNWHIRAEAIPLLSASSMMSPDGAKALITTFSNEQRAQVKVAMLKALKAPDTLRGDSATLDYLSGVLLSDTDPAVRSEAMLTKLVLSSEPHDAMPDVFAALTSKETELQSSALIALEQIYEGNELIDGGLDRIDHQATKRALKDFMKIDVTDENQKVLLDLLNDADNFYQRHFQDN